MAGYQYTMIVGNVGKDPDMRYTSSGVAVCDFSVAVSRKWTDKGTNEAKEEVTWFKVSAWRNLAETCNQYVHKGMQIMVAGRVSASAYLGQDGQPRSTLELLAMDVQFLGQRGDAPNDAGRESSDMQF